MILTADAIRRSQELVRMTSCWVARVIATYRSTAPSIPSPNVSGSMRTTRSNSSPFDSSGVSDRTRDVARNVGSPMTQAIPSACAASQVSRIEPRSEGAGEPVRLGTGQCGLIDQGVLEVLAAQHRHQAYAVFVVRGLDQDVDDPGHL